LGESREEAQHFGLWQQGSSKERETEPEQMPKALEQVTTAWEGMKRLDSTAAKQKPVEPQRVEHAELRHLQSR
jgi:hypothetical protein